MTLNLDKCCCKYRLPDSRPFYFDYTGQKVMLITSTPSFQAVYRQLASTRFFRHVYLALFGPSPAIGNQSLISFFQENIYWTHYHKCYIPIGLAHDYRNPPDLCRGRHLDKEIDEYELEIIVLFGAPVVQRLTGKMISGDYMETTLRSLSGRNVPCVCTNFPRTGAEEAMIKVRKKLEPIISQIDVAPVPESMVSPNAHEKDTFKVHAVYELNALRYYWNTIKSSGNPILVGNKNIDDIWIEREVLPSWLHYSFIVNCCSFIEDQVSALLAENPDLRNLHFMKCFGEMFRVYGKQELLNNRPQLTGEIRVLREIRNMIVHRGGRIDPLYGREYLLKKEIQDRKGLDIEPSGHIIVEEQFCEYALALVERFVRYITQFNTRY